jgi:cobalamin biosynthetic protein CobC
MVPAATLHRLPDKEALMRLLDVARRAYGVPPEVDLIAVPGTEVAIRLLPSLLPREKVAVLSPTYGSYAAAWPDADLNSLVPADATIAVVVNPNNPDGRIIPPAALPRARWLIVDEAFGDVVPEASVIPSMKAEAGRDTIVLRSLGKFYGLAGLRLGFVAGSPVMAQRLSDRLGDWPVSGPAIAIGAAVLADNAWRDAMRAQLKTEAAALRALLTEHHLAIVGGTDLFVLAETDHAPALHGALARLGVWTRAFADHRRWLRFGLPGAANLDRLASALSAAG